MSRIRGLPRHAGGVFLLLAVLVAAGVWTARRLPSAIFPTVTFPRIKVIAQAAEEPAAQMIPALTRPLEEAILRVPGIERVTSTTTRGAVELGAEFAWATDMRDLLAVLALVLVGFAAGLVARTGVGRALSEKLEQAVLRKMPGYTLLKGATAGTGGSEDSEVKVVLAKFDDNSVVGFVMEAPRGGFVTVFVPSAPTPAAGTVFILPMDRVQHLDVPVSDASKVIMRLGVGSQELLAKHRAAGALRESKTSPAT